MQRHAPGGELRPGFRMTIGANLGEIARVNAVFTEFAAAHGLPASIRRSVLVVLDELLNNTISYGFEGRERGEVSIEAELRADRLSVTLTDDGKPFNPLRRAAPDTTLPVDKRKIGGLGIHLVRQLMDDVSYHRRTDHNVLVLVKLLTDGMTEGS